MEANIQAQEIRTRLTPAPHAALQKMVHAVAGAAALASEVLSLSFTRAQSYHPYVFALQSCASGSEVTECVRRVIDVDVLDCIEAQVRELVRVRAPDHTLTDAEEQRAIQATLGAATLAEYGLWVYYPWARRLVHVLAEAEFVEVRTNRNRYKITPWESAELERKKVGVIGLSAGLPIALTLIAERSCGEIRLADFDTLQLSNLNRVPCGLQHLGQRKAIIAAREIAQLDPFIEVVCYPDGVDANNLDAFLTEGGKLDLLLEECDSIDIKFLARERARGHAIPVLMNTSDRGMLDVERFDREPQRPLLHGLAGNLDYRALRALTPEEKLPHVLKITGADTLSTRARASMLEVNQTLITWPQLASGLALGAAISADVARRILLSAPVASGRYYVDIERLVPGADEAGERAIPVSASVYPSKHYARGYCAQVLARLPTDAGGCQLQEEQIAALVNAGSAAPSGGNTQPWRWAFGERTLLLLRDGWGREFLDMGGLAACAATGAATENVLLAAQTLGLDPVMYPFPLGEEGDCVAAFRFIAAGAQQGDRLAEHIFSRRTDRRLGARRAIAAEVRRNLRACAESVRGALLHWVDEPESLREFEYLLDSAQRLLLQHPDGYRQLMSELRWGEDDQEPNDDGISVESLELTALDRAGLELCRDWKVIHANHAWGGGRALAKLVEKSVQSAAAICLITVPNYTLSDYFRGGWAMQRTWLAATAAKLALQPLSPLPYMLARLRARAEDLPEWYVTELGELQQRLEAVVPAARDRAGVLLFRLAVPNQALAPVPRSPRRALNKTLFRF